MEILEFLKMLSIGTWVNVLVVVTAVTAIVILNKRQKKRQEVFLAEPFVEFKPIETKVIPDEVLRDRYIRSCQDAINTMGEGIQSPHFQHRAYAALRIHGLTMGPWDRKVDPRYPGGEPALMPDIDTGYRIKRWPENTFIIWIGEDSERPVRIVCAATKGHDGWLKVGIRHGCHASTQMVRMLKDPSQHYNTPLDYQGFIDNYGVWHDRKESYLIAKAAGQLDRIDPRCKHLWQGDELYSEMLY